MIYFNVETLFHFQCAECKHWWSIGDFDIHHIDTLMCPYCRSHGKDRP